MKRDDRNLSVGERIKYALLAALLGVVAFLATACAGTRAQPATAGDDRTAGDDQATRAAATGHLPADADFVRYMIVHHHQALDMTALAPDRTDSDDMRLLAERIRETQDYEIDLMRRWLEERNELLPGKIRGEWVVGEHGGHGDHGEMAGMASPEQMAGLTESEGPAFDRMFLELMIRHHEGALIMVDELLETDGGGKEPNLFMMLSHIDADQRAEIARMRGLLDQMDETGENG